MAAKNHQRPPFRAEHMGSLLRPQALTAKRVSLDGKTALEIRQDDELRSLEDNSINDIVKEQISLGYRAIGDGEFRRHQFWGNFFPNLEGFQERIAPGWEAFRLYVPDTKAFAGGCLF